MILAMSPEPKKASKGFTPKASAGVVRRVINGPSPSQVIVAIAIAASPAVRST